MVIQGRTALYSYFEEKQRVQIFDLVRIAFTECDGSIRAGSHRINLNKLIILMKKIHINCLNFKKNILK
ncbi:hypothetical protein C1146_08460 [Clostridium botulinum]|nr:hypothetical protein C1146_08460 [Clostridium botulinum]